jgi:hypothetical protein
LDWPLREVVLAFLERQKREAQEFYKFELMMWRIGTAFGGGTQAPLQPEILRER